MSAPSRGLARTATRQDRKRMALTALFGAVTTLVIVAGEQLGALGPAERFAYDTRARSCQFFTPPPSDRIVHLDIDDASIEAIGRMPWSRLRLAQLLDVIGAAGPRLIFLDLTFQDPTTSTHQDRGGEPGDHPDDRALAQTIARLGNVVIPVNFSSFGEDAAAPDWRRELEAILSKDLTLDEDRLPEALRARGVAPPRDPDQLRNTFFAARRQAAYRRARVLMTQGIATETQVLEALIPGYLPGDQSPLTHVVEQQYHRARSMQALEAFTREPLPHMPTPLHARQAFPPIEPLGAAAAMSGFVDYESDRDGVVRSVPLFLEHDGRIYTQVALAMACRALGTDPREVRFEAGNVVIPVAGGSRRIVIPTRTVTSGAYGTFGAVMDIPWFGQPDLGWRTMYDHGKWTEPRQHVPMTKVWNAHTLPGVLRRNLDGLDAAIKTILEVRDPAQVAKFDARIAADHGPETRETEARSILADTDLAAQMKALAEDRKNGQNLGEDERLLLDRYESLPRLVSEVRDNDRKISRTLADLRNELNRDLADKIVLVGITATSDVKADLKPTPLHAQCPGVVIHGVVLNAILTSDVWSSVPGWFGPAATSLMGLAVAAAVAVLSPALASLLAGALFAGYLLVNCILFFDYGNTIAPLATPLAAVGLVWATCTVHRYVDERRSRARITARFRTYVDPALVDYVIEHPDQTSLAGETRELTVVFTDLAGFTTLAERLKGKTVPLLNEYLGLMVPVIRSNGGYVNKFLGDGIMFFFGAPRPDADHARHAAAAVWEMQRLSAEFNRRLVERGLPEVKMRAGVLTGEVVVGDAGSLAAPRSEDRASDYTVLGDNVNLASRLEGANKAVGTLTLLSHRTVEMLNGEFLVRPIARLQVVGKSQGVMTYEPLCPAAGATDDLRRLAELTREMVDHYLGARWDACLAAADRLEESFGPSRLLELYRRSCRIHSAHPPAQFAGEIVLTEK